MATQEREAARDNQADSGPLESATPKRLEPGVKTPEPDDESWLWRAYGVSSMAELKERFGVDEVPGATEEEAARALADADAMGWISLETAKRELGLD